MWSKNVSHVALPAKKVDLRSSARADYSLTTLFEWQGSQFDCKLLALVEYV